MKNNKLAFIGTGAMATATARVAYDSGYKNIIMYGIDEQERTELSNGINTKYFPNSVKLPNFKTTDELDFALENVSYIVIAVPSKVMDKVMNQIVNNLNSEVIIINVAKGFYPGTEVSLHEGITNKTKKNKFVKGVVSLIGPSHAEEIVTSTPTIVSVVGKDEKIIVEVQNIFNCEYFRTYMQTDVIGAEVGASYKNILAIASGISNGLGYGINTTAALISRGIAEMARFNKAMKGKVDTIMGLTGIGDLVVTAMSPLSRNFTFGKELASKGKKALKTTTTVEGIAALDIIYKIAKKKNLELPIINFLYGVIHEGKDMHKMINSLWNRGLKSE